MENRIVEVNLDQKKPPVINVGMRNITTIEFPARIEAIEGYGFYLPSEKSSAEGNLFELSYSKGANFFSIRALASGAEGNLTLVIDQRAYCFYFKEAAEPSFVVVCNDGRGPAGKTGADEGTGSPVPAEQKRASPERLSSLLDKAKGFEALRNSAPEMFNGITFAEPNKKGDIDQGVRTTIRRVLRDDELDSVVFDVEISNSSRADYFYDPEGFGARVGEKYYGESVSDASGVVPSGRAERVFFCVTGDGKGGRNDLAVGNDFDIAVRKVQGSHTQPIGWTAPPDLLPGAPKLGTHKPGGHRVDKTKKLATAAG
jgi:hypothetical protein